MEVASKIHKVITEMNYSPRGINNGKCGEFADRLLKKLGGKTNDVYVLTTDDFNYTNLGHKKHYTKFGGLPIGMSFAEVKLIDHAWVYCHGKHYDAQTPHGVDGYLNLTWFIENLPDIIEDLNLQKYKEKYRGHH
jgi:hypothetical protein